VTEDRIVGTVRANWFDSPATSARYHSFFGIDQFAGIPESRIAVCSRLAALLEHRYAAARGLLFDAIYSCGLDRGTELCFAACARSLVRLFRAYGFREYAPPVDDPVVGNLHRLVLVLDDLEHLARTGSSFHGLARQRSLSATERPWLRALLAAPMPPHAASLPVQPDGDRA